MRSIILCCLVSLTTIGVLCSEADLRSFEEILRELHLTDETIRILKSHDITNVVTLRSLSEDDIIDLGLAIGQRALLREFIMKLKSADGQDDNKFNEKQFWCLFKCLGGISAAGITGVMALAAIVLALPAVGFTTGGIVAGTLAAKIMALYGGAVSAGSIVSILQSVAVLGIGWKTILTAFFGSSVVMEALTKKCTHCMEL